MVRPYAVSAVFLVPIILAACGRTRSVEAILAEFEGAEPPQRSRLAIELRAHGKAAVDAWVRVLDDDRRDYNSYVVAAGELGALGAAAAGAVPALVRFIRDGFPGMSMAEMVIEQRFAVRDAGRRPAREALDLIGAPAVEPVRRLLADGNDRARQEAALTLGQIGSPAAAAVPDLIAGLGDASKPVATAAAWALGQIRDADPRVLAALAAALQDEERFVRFEALRALGNLGDQAAGQREAVRKLAGDADPAVRKMAQEVLDRLPAQDAAATAEQGGTKK